MSKSKPEVMNINTMSRRCALQQSCESERCVRWWLSEMVQSLLRLCFSFLHFIINNNTNNNSMPRYDRYCCPAEGCLHRAKTPLWVRNHFVRKHAEGRPLPDDWAAKLDPLHPAPTPSASSTTPTTTPATSNSNNNNNIVGTCKSTNVEPPTQATLD
jgi:hypothetical protein